MDDQTKQLYNMKLGESLIIYAKRMDGKPTNRWDSIATRYTKVPGGWICQITRGGTLRGSPVFVPSI